jgi:CRP-like cAMP-binding protein
MSGLRQRSRSGAAAASPPGSQPAPLPPPRVTSAADLDARSKVRIIQAGPGSVIGELDWVLRRPRAFQCVAASRARVLVLTRDAHARMARDAPHANGMLLQILLRSSLVTTVHALQALERAVQ